MNLKMLLPLKVKQHQSTYQQNQYRNLKSYEEPVVVRKQQGNLKKQP